MLNRNNANERIQVVLESLTLLALMVLVFWAVAPLLEEWGVINALNTQGLGYLRFFASEIIMRPLHLTPYTLEWALGNGHPGGVAAGVGVLMVMRYFVVRWAVTPFLQGKDRWVVATLAAVLVAWPGVWLGRFSSAQLSAVFFFAALGFAVRVFQRRSLGMGIGCACSVLLLLMTYQGLVLCLIALPFLSMFWHRTSDSMATDAEKNDIRNKAVRIFLSLAVGFVIYGIYWFVMSRMMGNGGYDGSLAANSSRLLSASSLWSHIEVAFATAYGQELFLLPFLVLMASFLYWNEAGTVGTVKSRFITGTIVFLVVALLPLLSIIYVSELHIRDIDRVLYPVSIGFVLVCLTILIRYRDRHSVHSNLLSSSLIVVALLTASGVLAHQIKHYANIQNVVIEQTLIAANQSNAHSVTIRDTTGIIGDVYTLLPPTLTDAISVYGKSITATICTPSSVDRIHPVARRYPITSTQRCEELPAASDGTLILTARMVNGLLTLAP